MTRVIVLLILFGIAALLARFLLKKLENVQGRAIYRRRDALFTEAERKFLLVLESVLRDQYRVFGKVRVADVIEPGARQNTGEWQSAFNRIKAKHFDYIICNQRDLSIVAAVELDDSSHTQHRRRDRDDLLNKACAAAELPLIRFPANPNYDIASIRTRLMDALGSEESSRMSEADKLCPNCGHALERITGQDGALAGRAFWRCTHFQTCRTIIPVLQSH